eukprot:g47369.t1
MRNRDGGVCRKREAGTAQPQRKGVGEGKSLVPRSRGERWEWDEQEAVAIAQLQQTHGGDGEMSKQQSLLRSRSGLVQVFQRRGVRTLRKTNGFNGSTFHYFQLEFIKGEVAEVTSKMGKVECVDVMYLDFQKVFDYLKARGVE